MPKVSKFTKEQKLEIALELLSGKLSHGADSARVWKIEFSVELCQHRAPSVMTGAA